MPPGYEKMAGSSGRLTALTSRMSVRLILSYALDWIVVIAFAAVAAALGVISPNKRPFSLTDPNISFPFTESEACPPWLLLVLNALVPIAFIFVVSLVFIPGATVPRDTPRTLLWKRKLWELHVGWLGLALSLVTAWFFTQATKNMFGKPRPDLLDRCQPDLSNAASYAIGGFAGEADTGRLYSADICQQTDSAKLDDGFRSYPSGHSSSAAAGLVYLSLFLASKFAVNVPFVPSGNSMTASLTSSAFPSRRNDDNHFDDADSANAYDASAAREAQWQDASSTPSPYAGKVTVDQARHNQRIQASRRQAAAPPIYLLAIVLAPFATSVWIAGSRWYDFRHHGFDILFGYTMGVITAFMAFRLYHMPMRHGAGWAWGPRSHARAFWAGVGRLGYAGDRRDFHGDQGKRNDDGPAIGRGAVRQHGYHPAVDDTATEYRSPREDARRQQKQQQQHYGDAGPYGQDDLDHASMSGAREDVEMQPMNHRD